jgi:hyaluronate lyase
VLTQEHPGQIDLGVSDPTQTNAGTIIVEIARPAGAVLAVSPGVTVLQLSPTIRASINVNGANGRTFTATFSLLPAVSIVAAGGSRAGAVVRTFARK